MIAYIEKLKELIPVFELTPETYYKNPEEGIYNIDYLKYEKTGEKFDYPTEIFKGMYDLVNKKVVILETIIIKDNWITDRLIGKSVLSNEISSQGKREATILTIKNIDYFTEEEGGNTYFINKTSLNNFLLDNKKEIIKRVKNNYYNELEKEDTIIKIVEPKIYGTLSDGTKELIKYLIYIK